MGLGIHPSKCGAEAYDNVVIVTELSDNPGTSVTNAAEAVASEACRRFGIDPNSLVLIEHYPMTNDDFDETFDIVKLNVAPNATSMPLGRDIMFSSPQWTRISKEHVQALTREDL